MVQVDRRGQKKEKVMFSLGRRVKHGSSGIAVMGDGLTGGCTLVVLDGECDSQQHRSPCAWPIATTGPSLGMAFLVFSANF